MRFCSFSVAFRMVMAHETYLIAKTVLRRVKASSEIQTLDLYVQRIDFRSLANLAFSISTSTVAACSRATQNLQHLSITSEEKEILEETKTIDGVAEFITQYVAEVDKKRHHNKTWKKVYAFSKFAGPVLEVFKQANFTPECSIALGLLGMLLIQVRRIKIF